MTTLPSFVMPARYQVVACLGKGGGGEVWAVRDRVTGADLAFKVLSENAGEAETMALVREAAALSGLEGLGVPRVVAFGSLPREGRRFLVRELIEGRSFEALLESGDPDATWLRALACAADQLTVLHRAGLFHGDIKPANIIVDVKGIGTLVDLGLATRWKEGGAYAQGLTPKYAAPELFEGDRLTVRGEVFSLGATLADALAARGGELPASHRGALGEVAARATAREPNSRYPSVDEFVNAMKTAAQIATQPFDAAAAWPVLGLEGPAGALAAEVNRLMAGSVLAVVGPRRSGRTTLLRRLSWSLGVSGSPVANVEPGRMATCGVGGISSSEVIELELDPWGGIDEPVAGLVIVVDDLSLLDESARLKLRRATRSGASLVVVGDALAAAALAREGGTQSVVFEMPPLDESDALNLLMRAVPSLPQGLTRHILERVEWRPGRLRSFVKRLGRRALTSAAEIDALIDFASDTLGSGQAPLRARAEAHAGLKEALDTGRFDIALESLQELAEPKNDSETVEFAIARARIFLARGETLAAEGTLDSVEQLASLCDHARAWLTTRARTYIRAGDFARAAALAEQAATLQGSTLPRGADEADALAVRGVALSYLGQEASALEALHEAVALARSVHDARIEAVALGSLSIAHHRSGRAEEARHTCEAALAAAEKARDAWTLATTRLHLAGLSKADGDLAQSLVHLEAALDMGRRAGALIAVQQALFNLTNLDLYLGRYARARGLIAQLVAQRDRLAPSARAQLLGLEAEYATRIGEVGNGSERYEACAKAYDALARPLDAAEARLEGILARLGSASSGVDLSTLTREATSVQARLREGGFKEHEPLTFLVHGLLSFALGDEAAARVALDHAIAKAMETGQHEWAWQALDARARLASSQGGKALARRDIEAAVLMLEETSGKLPRDLREVFWNDPRRRALRLAHGTPTLLAASFDRTPLDARASTGIAHESSGAMEAPTRSALPSEDRLARIFEITRDLAREHELDRLLVAVTNHAVGLLGAERGLIVLVNENGGVDTHTARDNKGGQAAQNFSRSVAERVIREGLPVVATSARDDASLAQAVSVHQLLIQSIACVPIRGAPPAGKTIGALYVETRLRPGVRFRAELPALEAFADQAAIAIESARLIGENKRRADELQVANDELERAKATLAGLLGRRTEQLHSARRDLKQVRSELRSHFGYAGLVGTSLAMRRLYSIIDRVRETDVPLLITGESGTGKEVVARAVHLAGPRAKQPFLGVNCGAIPANLLESELFGHARGAFTGADRERKGLFREAENGTLLLDEIGEMPKKMQAALLRVLQEKTVRPVGGATEDPCSARVIAATHRDLAQMVAEGTFREDLFYRINIIELKVPALRDRIDDVPALIDHFFTLFSSRHGRERKLLSRAATRALQGFNWPGNVRQLEHVLLNAWLLCETHEITVEDLDLPAPVANARNSGSDARHGPSSPREIAKGGTGVGATGTTVLRPRTKDEHDDKEKEQILAALTLCHWNRVQAAKLIGIPRRTFYRRLKEYGLL